MCRRFDTTPACDRRTDRQTDRQTDRIAVASTALAMRTLRRAVKSNGYPLPCDNIDTCTNTQEQLTNYLNKINHPAFDADQYLALLLAVKEYEDLKPLCRRLFFTSATSAPVERVFSTSRLIMRPHRAHVSNSLLQTLMFLKRSSGL